MESSDDCMKLTTAYVPHGIAPRPGQTCQRQYMTDTKPKELTNEDISNAPASSVPVSLKVNWATSEDMAFGREPIPAAAASATSTQAHSFSSLESVWTATTMPSILQVEPRHCALNTATNRHYPMILHYQSLSFAKGLDDLLSFVRV